MAGIPHECAVCAKIPRVVVDEETVAVHGKLLVPPIPEGDIGRFLTRCPECGAWYAYGRTTERDITYETVDVELRRPSDAELPDLLPPAARAAFAAELPARTARWRSALDHPAEWMRREAAWNLAALGRREKRWDDHIALLGHVDADVRHELALFAVRDDAFAEAPDEVAAALAHLRESDDERARGPAARAFTAWRLARGESRAVIDEVVREADAERILGALRAVRYAFTPALAAEAVRTFALLHREEAVRDVVAMLLEECAREGQSERLVPGLLDFLRSDDPATAKAALRIFRAVRLPCAELVPLLPRWCLDRKTQFHAYGVLEAQARLGTDLSALLPLVGDRLETFAATEPAAPANVLLAMLEHATDPLPVIRELLRGIPGRWDTTIVSSIDRAAQRGANLRPVEPTLRRLLDDANAAKREFTAGWLRQLLGHIPAP